MAESKTKDIILCNLGHRSTTAHKSIRLLSLSIIRMMGGIDVNIQEMKSFFESRGLIPTEPGVSLAVDLGCG